MSRLLVAAAFLLLLVAPLGAAAQAPCDEWVAFAPTPGEDSGIGGTGRSGEGDDSGIGGTGIYGAITQFGSLCVNGVRVHLEPGTPIEINGRSTSSDALQIGHVVWVRADLREQRLVAAGVEAHSAVVGTVAAVDAEASRLVVGDRAVRIVPDTRLIDRATGSLIDVHSLRPGDVVDVSGLVRRSGTIVATRITRRTPDWHERYLGPPLEELLRDTTGLGHVSIEGFARYGPTARSLDVAGLQVDLSSIASTAARQVAPETRVWLRGELTKDGAVRAEQLAVRVPPAPPGVIVPLEPVPESRVPEPPIRRVPLGASDAPGRRMPPDTKPVPIPEPVPLPTPVPPREPPTPIEPQPPVIEPDRIPSPGSELAPRTNERP